MGENVRKFCLKNFKHYGKYQDLKDELVRCFTRDGFYISSESYTYVIYVFDYEPEKHDSDINEFILKYG